MDLNTKHRRRWHPWHQQSKYIDSQLSEIFNDNYYNMYAVLNILARIYYVNQYGLAYVVRKPKVITIAFK